MYTHVPSQVVRLYDFFPLGSAMVLAFEYMQTDLAEVMRSLASRAHSLSEQEIKTVMIMLLKGIHAIHSNQILHRVSFAFICIQTLDSLSLSLCLSLSRIHFCWVNVWSLITHKFVHTHIQSLSLCLSLSVSLCISLSVAFEGFEALKLAVFT